LPDKIFYVSMQLPLDPQGRMVSGDAKRQIETTLSNLSNLFKDADFKMSECVQLRVYLTDMANEKVFSSMVSKYFVGGALPAISIIGVAALPGEATVAMEAVAVRPAEPT